MRLIVRVARENPTWGYTRLRGALKNLGHELGRNTIKRLLAEHGIAPAPERGRSMSWSTFIKAHWGAIAATDLFTVEVVNPFGLVRYHVLFVIDITCAFYLFIRQPMGRKSTLRREIPWILRGFQGRLSC